MITGVKVDGLKELRAAFRQAENATPKAIATANRAGAQIVVDNAQPPRRTGRLAGSMRATGSQKIGTARAGGARVPYGPAIHWGRKRGNVGRPPGNHPGDNRIAGRPFLTESAHRSITKIVRAFEASIRPVIEAVKTKG